MDIWACCHECVLMEKSDSCGRAAYFVGENFNLIGCRTDVDFTAVEVWGWEA